MFSPAWYPDVLQGSPALRALWTRGIPHEARLSGDGRWLVWPSMMGADSVVRVWSVGALLAFARDHAVMT